VADDIRWDGSVYPYVAPDELTIDPSLRLHRRAAETIDPIVHELLRYALWNVNTEHGTTMMKISGSPICAYAHDFNPVILDEQGDYVFFGPFLQYLSAATNSAVKWTLERRSGNPGINPGDIFLNNDPWVGAPHQSDVAIYAPVFVDGELFCWVANTLHQHDLGGTAPGGFNPIAEDVFWEAPSTRAVKIVEGGVIRRDIEETYLWASRVPDLVALDLRAQIAGCNVARDRIVSLVERYGAAVVKGTMGKIQDDAERAFMRRLDTIPDGTWSEDGWIEGALPGDRDLYLNRITLTKRGDQLTFSNAGSAKQHPSSITFAGWSAAIFAVIAPQMLFDQMLAIEGAARHIEFDVEPDLITSASRPTAVQGGTGLVLAQTLALTGVVVSKMLATSTDPELRTEIQSSMANSCFPINTIDGIDQRGERFSAFLLDPAGAAFPAYSWRDGQDTGGWPWDLQSTMPNVEEHELAYPMLYLWRKELPDSGGAGKFRGGNVGEFAYVPHMTEKFSSFTVSGACAVPAPALFGGYPASTNKFQFIVGAKVWDQIQRTGSIPGAVSEIEDGESTWVPAKSADKWPTPEDVWICSWTGGGGYGDPLERDPEMVRKDIAGEQTTVEWARRAYGVVVEGSGDALVVDQQATAELRREMGAARLAESRPWSGTVAAAHTADVADGRINDDLEIRDGEILSGGVPLGSAGRNYKYGTRIRDVPLQDVNPHIRDPGIYTDCAVVLREYLCPSTGRLLQTEVIVDGAEPLWDLQVGA
jgi:N-methylhydantoinase B